MSDVIHVLRTPMHEHGRKRMPREMWCFQCRKCLPHDAVLWVCDDPRSYYGPHWAIECFWCHEDHTHFPGTEWSYDDA